MLQSVYARTLELGKIREETEIGKNCLLPDFARDFRMALQAYGSILRNSSMVHRVKQKEAFHA